MFKVIINIRTVLIDFNSENFEEYLNYIESFKFYTNKPFEEKVEELFISILKIKGDWAHYDLITNENILIVDYDLLFTSTTLTDSDKKVIDMVLNTTKQLIENIKVSTVIDSHDIFKSDKDNNEDKGIILKLEKHGEVTTDHKEIETYLNNKNIKYSVVSKNSSHTESGAGGGGSELLLFIATTIASGVTWDMLKMGLSQIMPPFEGTTFKVLESYHFKRVRNIVANRSKIDKNELILIDFIKNEDEGLIQMVFKANKKYIYICCDTKYNTLVYKLSNKKIVKEMLESN
ncbi:hypothetical protein [Oceanobacillus oncorhynchi]|uniref:hypothetical protein n=1 Tax=Oceanobacillus oncorhynchi TaxID=545501 RepID=UPI0018662FAC|nr:hypothetical protein [Oceanobacillus oncorhynchi]